MNSERTNVFLVSNTVLMSFLQAILCSSLHVLFVESKAYRQFYTLSHRW